MLRGGKGFLRREEVDLGLPEPALLRRRHGDMLAAGVMNGLARTWSDPRKFLYDVNKGLWAHHNKLSPDVV